MNALYDAFRSAFGREPSIWAASPGRVEFIGNHTDYNGGEVLGMALDRRVQVAAAALPEHEVWLRSDGIETAFTIACDKIAPQQGGNFWVNYPLGIVSVLQARGISLPGGIALQFASNLPAGAGLSSSAAIELATLEAIDALFGLQLAPLEKVLIAQEAENKFVGVPCGILDQSVSCFGRRDHLVRINCADTEITNVPIPPDLHVWIFNTGIKHALVDSFYSDRHRECREALRLIQERHPEVAHLALAPESCLQVLPEDGLLLKRAIHVVCEQQRVRDVIGFLEAGNASAVGDALFASHRSSRDLFENSIPELDFIVESLAEQRGTGVIGARLTGGGFGGAVMALTRAHFLPDEVIKNYQRAFPCAAPLSVFHVQSGDGTCSGKISQ